LACRINREQALHFCPLYPKAESMTPAMAKSRSASSSTKMAFLPPVSKISRLGNGASAAAVRIRRAVSSDPVKAMKRVRGSFARAAPTVSPGP
jgi:hypothetical protein